MSDGRASESGEETNVETAMAAVDGPRATTLTIMRPGKVYPLSSSRLAADVKWIAVQLELPGTVLVSRGQTLFRTEGKGLGFGHRATCRPGI